MTAAEELIGILQLEQLDTRLFRGLTKDIGSPNVFGGQVLAQALSAATKTVPKERVAHSLHSYFILPGDKSIPIIYEVDIIRDGGSFTTRRVTAIQNGKAIFIMAASFQVPQDGFSHQAEMPEVPAAEKLFSYADWIEKAAPDLKGKLTGLFERDGAFDARPVEVINPFNPGINEPVRHLWFRWTEPLPEDQSLHRYLLAYFSDFALLTTSLLPHNLPFFSKKIQLASLDHGMWFHRDFNLNDWLLYAIESPNASNTRGFSRGQIFTQEGKLIASVAQEGLIRQRRPKV